ncbi:hypothetical protein TSOC_011032 [Tetrabaena socialis]|uniref:Uncharacterized protein n=1 Tax=Tetrabaena socialis TaxID=47790 RepID=A0A2J7ZRT9_9CHLO|nr:hypothetical protein TSOC_011032 [Tetrabaena socialis]|eukprot:PNH02950.1 hypothetical protein TSOC_011032 [Tetrabaena socialis]
MKAARYGNGASDVDHEDKAPGHETSICSVWALLEDVLAEAQQRGVGPSAGPRYVDALAAGARRHLERGHKAHVRSTISRYKLAAERGADPDYLREVQAYVQGMHRAADAGQCFIQYAIQ